MPAIRTVVDEATYATLTALRKKLGLPSVSALFLHKAGVLDDSMVAAEIVKRAKKRALEKDGGDRFRLRDLFRKSEWEKFSKSARLRAGRLFFESVSAAVDGIRAEAKSVSGHQFYIKA